MVDRLLCVPPAVYGNILLSRFQGHLFDTAHMVSGPFRRDFLDLLISVPDWLAFALRVDQRPFPDERASGPTYRR